MINNLVEFINRIRFVRHAHAVLNLREERHKKLQYKYCDRIELIRKLEIENLNEIQATIGMNYWEQTLRALERHAEYARKQGDGPSQQLLREIEAIKAEIDKFKKMTKTKHGLE